uniref:Reverse transcriptase zinc-binding domain-containing protein n=1 Tax=Lactuca sativa TaxID=4236 RepID=A0A9R1WDR1_LACSA|nr:hypothetical protein LSAT_V11C200062490 [Lactuca sativa]
MQMVAHIILFIPSNAPDVWSCDIVDDGSFIVAALRRKMDAYALTTVFGKPIVWMNEVPLKVLCLIWREKWGRIPSTAALASRGLM